MLIHKTMKMPTSCLSCWIAPTCEVWVREKSKYKGYDNRLDECPLEEVVRCKDCKFYWKNSVMTNVPLCLASPREDAFCSDGGRREDDTVRTV